MKIQSLKNKAFGKKNTFLKKSNKALVKSRELLRYSKSDATRAQSSFEANMSSYYHSLYLEALARLSNQRALKAKQELAKIDKVNKFKDVLKVTNLHLKKAFNKFNSFISICDAQAEYPERFDSPDKHYNY